MEGDLALIQEILAMNYKMLEASGFHLCEVEMINRTHLGGVRKTHLVRQARGTAPGKPNDPQASGLSGVHSSGLRFLWLCKCVGGECILALPSSPQLAPSARGCCVLWPLPLFSVCSRLSTGRACVRGLKALPGSLLPLGLLVSQGGLGDLQQVDSTMSALL